MAAHIQSFKLNASSGFLFVSILKRQIESNSGSAIPNILSALAQISVRHKDSIIANLVLLLESDLIDESKNALNAHIPPGSFTFTLSAKWVCDSRCPVPSDWSPWTCHCPRSDDDNPDNLVDCRSGSQKRSRIQVRIPRTAQISS